MIATVRAAGSASRAVLTAGVIAALAAGLVLTAARSVVPQPQGIAPVRLTVWRHDGQPAEQTLLAEQIRRFERATPGVRVSIVQVPEADYPDRVQLAAVRSELPDVLDVDGPLLMNYVYQGVLAPLDGLVAARTRDDLTPSIRRQGTLDGRLYGVGAIDSGLGLFASRQALRAVGARIPRSWADAWTADEFDGVLRRLAARDRDGKVLDIALDYDVGEWYTYAFAPVVWSAGGSFGRPPEFSGAREALPTDAAATALARLGGWTARYVDKEGDNGSAFTSRRVALSWAGHWWYAAYRQALGDDLAVLPLPDFGQGARTTSGSWAWAVSAGSRHPRQAAALLDFLLTTDEVLAASEASGGPPGTVSASLRETTYRPGGPLALFGEALAHVCGTPDEPGCVATVRPPTPAYPVITNAFQEAVHDVLAGGNARTALRRASAIIDRDVRSNAGYGLRGG